MLLFHICMFMFCRTEGVWTKVRYLVEEINERAIIILVEMPDSTRTYLEASRTGPMVRVGLICMITCERDGWRYYYFANQLIKVEDLSAALIWYKWQRLVIIFLFLFLSRRERKWGCISIRDLLSLCAVGWGPPACLEMMSVANILG